MNRHHLRKSAALRLMLLSAGLVFVCGPTGWAADFELGAPGPLLPASQSSPQDGYAEQPPLVQSELQEHAAPPKRGGTRSNDGSRGTEPERVDLTASAAPRVTVRVGDHGGFERVAFEWPTPIDCDVVQNAEQVTIAFSRQGRIDVSGIADRMRRVVEAWTEEDDATVRVALRVSPNARVRWLNLEDGRVVIDVFGGTAAQGLVPPALSPEQDIVRELRRALEQRDAVIEQRNAVIEQLRSRLDRLAARFERLEQALALSSGDLDRVAAGQAGAAPPVGDGQAGAAPSVGDRPRSQSRSPSVAAVEPSGEPSGKPPEPRSEAVTPEQQSATTSRGPIPEGTGAGARRETAQSQAPAPGQVEVDEEAVERALDFTLVQEGALLLPAGRAEITPRFSYTRRAGDFPVIVDPGGANLLGEREVRRNEFDFFAGLQVGLPFDSQLELGLPYNLVDQSIVDRVGGSGVEESSDMGHGLGDFSVGLAKTVLREEGWWPDVILRANWDTGTGERLDNDVALDGGFQDIRGSVSLTKRQDPLVFVGGAFYETVFEEDDIDSGDRFGFNIGTFLAASPNTSLSVVLNQSFIDEFEVGGQRIDGSDRVESILSFGAGAVLGRNFLLSAAVGVGLTDDSPDYSVSISLPVRFSIPGL